MVKKGKIYKIIKTRKGKDSIIEGTLEELITYFSYTLEVGNSYNKKINKKPKTIKSLITNLENALSEKEGACYDRTFIELINE